jgi:hypothetical protein
MKMGRPPKAPEDRRDDDVKIPLTTAEKAAIWEAAEGDGEKPITWSRKILLKAAKRRQRS